MNDEIPLTDTPPDEATALAEIDAMSYGDMLRKVRCAPLGDPLFRGGIGIYFHAQMKKKRGALSPEARVEISKQIGF